MKECIWIAFAKFAKEQGICHADSSLPDTLACRYGILSRVQELLQHMGVELSQAHLRCVIKYVLSPLPPEQKKGS